MPEGPTILLLSEELKQFEGNKITGVRGNSKAGIEITKDAVIAKIQNWGKQLLISLDNGYFIAIHLMLFGRYAVNEKKPDRNERLGIDTPTGEFNFYACSVKIQKGQPEDFYDWSVDVLSDRWDPREARKKILKLGNEMICDTLLSQDVFSGVGNVIKNEVLFRQKVHPRSKTGNIDDEILDKLIKDTRDFSFQFLEWKRVDVLKANLKVHNKKTCPRCGVPILVEVMGKTKRKAHFCTNCQVQYLI